MKSLYIIPKKEGVASWIHVHRTKLKWIYNLTGQECTHGTVMYCYPVVPGIFMIWLPRFDSHRTEQSSHFSVTQKIICSWSTAAVLFSWKVSIASCTPVSACCNGTVDLPPATPEQVLAAPSQRELEWLSNRSVLRQVISDRRNQPHFSAFPIALGFWRNKESSWKK